MGTTLKISDDVRWGKLVKSWATGRNYFDAAGQPIPIPRTLDELVRTASGVGVDIVFPDGMVGLAVIQYSPQTAVVKLPPKAMVEETEAQLRQPGAVYPMPPFYEQFFESPLPAMSTEDLFNLHAARIGDYSIRNCG
ncbi:hypothetical protein CI1B_16810 [Bradyrhizobium ivorense]|uniref:Uncharacterized protein n=1 Tax=Bradyrhizobium ivorense TaxID=2511166 RepID=A0A508SV91_9BRAD|nr:MULTISPECIES: hypothetical protein [Bradyrhizobium]QOZ29173.1 hypothetical protein XH93_40715 [Bradyrhizobium sp. CCBAU 51753]VIO66559.1 hypothetical protein CI1B_16810 [Bradyrhizobium ivorense]